jgi:signal transduction histidine kinase
LRVLAGEQAALRRVATLVARATPADKLFAAVVEEVGRLLAADYARLARYDPDDMITVFSTWTRTGRRFPVGERFSLAGDNVSVFVLRTGRPARIDDFAGASGPLAAEARERGVRSTIGVPIVVEGRIWGVMSAGAIQEWAAPADAEARLADFTELVATAIANAESRAALARLAEEQAALRRVATLAAHGAAPEEVFAVVAEEVGQLLPVDMVNMCRYESDRTLTFLAAWDSVSERFPVGSRRKLGGHNIGTIVFDTSRPARVDNYADSPPGTLGATARDGGLRSAVGTPIIVEGRLWGVISAGSSQELLPLDTEARLTSFTELLATAIANAESRAALAASRARIVAAADETRRQIERDLHDGIQQRLVSLMLDLRMAQAAESSEAGELKAQLARTERGLAGVVEELREISHGIHPAILSKGGLGPALKALARRFALPVELDLRAGRLPGPVEVAAYYAVSEALTNAAKHARASVVHVALDARDSVLKLAIRDDGIGGADPAGGSGLTGLSDRIEALGGTLAVTSPAGSGTTLLIEMPAASPKTPEMPEP